MPLSPHHSCSPNSLRVFARDHAMSTIPELVPALCHVCATCVDAVGAIPCPSAINSFLTDIFLTLFFWGGGGEAWKCPQAGTQGADAARPAR